jgi:hypothetical protein
MCYSNLELSVGTVVEQEFHGFGICLQGHDVQGRPGHTAYGTWRIQGTRDQCPEGQTFCKLNRVNRTHNKYVQVLYCTCRIR